MKKYNITKAIILLIAIVYIVSPVDLMPLVELDDGAVGLLAGYLLH